MMKILKMAAASASALLGAGCVAYPYYDDPYYSDGAYYSSPSVAYAPPSVNFRYYEYNDGGPRYYYHQGHRYTRDGRGKYWRDDRNHRDHRYYDGR